MWYNWVGKVNGGMMKMTAVQKIWSEEAYMKYPKQWIVFVEM
jgi:hypothetical protein